MPIHVALRSRPIPPTEERACELGANGRHIGLRQNSLELRFNIPKFFNENATNGEIADSLLPPMIDKAIGGFVSAIIAYGQTNSGKSYTILGDNCLFVDRDHRRRSHSARRSTDKGHGGSAGIPDEDRDTFKESSPDQEGLIIHGLRRIYALGFQTKLSFLEVYREKLYDLQTKNTPYTVLSDVGSNSDRGFYHATSTSSLLSQLNTNVAPQLHQATGEFKHLTDTTCPTLEQAFSSLKGACRQRMTASTVRNEVSSRSHFLCITTILRKIENAGNSYAQLGKIYFCDLAGSERFDSFGPGAASSCYPSQKMKEEQRFAEGVNINKSLLTLRKVLEDLAARKSHIPYRASMLTKILQLPFENGYVTFIANVNTANLQETKRTMDYACITRQITFTRMPSAITTTAHCNDLGIICQDCMNKVLNGLLKLHDHLEVLHCKFCGNLVDADRKEEYNVDHEVGYRSEHKNEHREDFKHPKRHLHIGHATHIGHVSYPVKKSEGFGSASAHKASISNSRNTTSFDYDPLVALLAHVHERVPSPDSSLYSSSRFNSGNAQRRTNIANTASTANSDASHKKSARVVDSIVGADTETSSNRPFSAIDVISQECVSTELQSPLASVASLLYGLDAQADNQPDGPGFILIDTKGAKSAKTTEAVEALENIKASDTRETTDLLKAVKTTPTMEASIQTIPSQPDTPNDSLEKDTREESPGVWDVYEASLRKTQIYLPHGVTKGMNLSKTAPSVYQSQMYQSSRSSRASEKSLSHSVLDMIEESNSLYKANLKLSVAEKANKKVNSTYILAVVCNEILETKKFELDALNYSNMCLRSLYSSLARIVCEKLPKFEKLHVENAADYKVLMYKLKKQSTLNFYNYEQLRMDAFSESYCQVDPLFDNFISIIKRFEQMESKGEIITNDMISIAADSLISGLTRTVMAAVYECFDALMEEMDGALSLSSLSQQDKASFNL